MIVAALRYQVLDYTAGQCGGLQTVRSGPLRALQMDKKVLYSDVDLMRKLDR